MICYILRPFNLIDRILISIEFPIPYSFLFFKNITFWLTRCQHNITIYPTVFIVHRYRRWYLNWHKWRLHVHCWFCRALHVMSLKCHGTFDLKMCLIKITWNYHFNIMILPWQQHHCFSFCYFSLVHEWCCNSTAGTHSSPFPPHTDPDELNIPGNL